MRCAPYVYVHVHRLSKQRPRRCRAYPRRADGASLSGLTSATRSLCTSWMKSEYAMRGAVAFHALSACAVASAASAALLNPSPGKPPPTPSAASPNSRRLSRRADSLAHCASSLLAFTCYTTASRQPVFPTCVAGTGGASKSRHAIAHRCNAYSHKC